MSGREKGAAKAPFPHDEEGGQICGGKGLVTGSYKKGKTLGLCSDPARGVAKAPDKRCGTETLLLPGWVSGQVYRVREGSKEEGRRLCNKKMIKGAQTASCYW